MQVPFDEEAEEEVIGCALRTPWGAELARARLEPEDFYVPAHQRLFAVAHRITAEQSDVEGRAAQAARLGEVPERVALALLTGGCVMADSGGAYAKRVAAAARRRRAMEALAEAYNAIGEGEPVEAALEVVGQL